MKISVIIYDKWKSKYRGKKLTTKQINCSNLLINLEGEEKKEKP